MLGHFAGPRGGGGGIYSLKNHTPIKNVSIHSFIHSSITKYMGTHKVIYLFNFGLPEIV